MTKNNPLKRIAASGASDRGDAAIYDLLGYQAIARAGQPQSLTGEALVDIGRGIAQLDFSDPLADEVLEKTEEEKKEPNLSKLEKTEPNLTAKKIDLGRTNMENVGKSDFKYRDPVKPPPPPPPQNQGKFGTLLADPARGGIPGTFTKNPNTGMPVEQKGQTYFTPVGAGGGIRLSSTPGIQTRSLGEIFRSLFMSSGDNTPNKRLSDDFLTGLEILRYNRKGYKDTPLRRVVHAVSSPFLKTDDLGYNRIRRLTTPDGVKAGGIAGAFAGGFNLVADTYNYNQAVREQYDKELDDEMGDLNVEATFVDDNARRDFLELGFEKKKRQAEAFNLYARGKMSSVEYKNIKATLKSELDQVAGTVTALTNLKKEFAEQKGTHDLLASKPNMLDFHNTLEKNPERISIKNIDGIDYAIGTTIGDGKDPKTQKEFKVPTSSIANGTAGFRLVAKEDLNPLLAGAGQAIDQFNKGQEYIKTEYGLGIEKMSSEQAKKVAVDYLKVALGQDKNKLRSYLSQIAGIDYNAYEELIKDGKVPDQLLTDVASELYDERMAPLYQQQTQTTRFATQRQPSKGSAAERTQKQMLEKYNATELPTASNILDYSIDVLGGKDFEVRELEDGTYGVFKQGKPDQTLSILDLNKPEQAKRILFNYGGLKPYSLPTK
jgi:hypothetical protein